MDKKIMDCFDNIYGYESTKKELYTLASAIKNSNSCKELGISVPRGIVLYGEPGLGKTTMAIDLIAASERYPIIFRKQESREFAKSLKETFLLAKQNQPSIILLDDMDKYSNTDENHQNTDEYVAIQTCIDDVKNDNVVIIATANDNRCFPSSLLRAGRFDRKIWIQAPTVKEATVILQMYLNKASVADDIDAESIARLMSGKSCAALEAIINEAGIYAIAREQHQIDMKCMVDACLSVFYHASESLDESNKEKQYKVAVHEAGHAVAHELLFPNSTALVSTRMSNSGGEGITVFDIENDSSMEQSEKIIMCGLAGRAAHEVKFGEPDMGSSNDIKQSLSKATNLICYQAYNGLKKTDSYSEYESSFTKTQIDIEVNFLIGQLYQKVKKLIADNLEIVDAVAQELFDKDTLLGKDVRRILERYLPKHNSNG